MNTYNMDVDFNYDYAKVIELEAVEKLSVEDMEDGLEPMAMTLKLCLPEHVFKRMNKFGRQFDMEDVIDLVDAKSHKLFDLSHGSEFAIVNEMNTLGLVCHLYNVKDQNSKEQVLALVLSTVIRKVIVDKNHREYERKVYFDKSMQKL